MPVVLELARRHYQEPLRAGVPLSTTHATHEFLQMRLRDLSYEVFCCLWLDNRNRVIAEYALRDTAKAMGVATFETSLPAALRDSLPSPAELARALDNASSGGSAPDHPDTV